MQEVVVSDKVGEDYKLWSWHCAQDSYAKVHNITITSPILEAHAPSVRQHICDTCTEQLSFSETDDKPPNAGKSVKITKTDSHSKWTFNFRFMFNSENRRQTRPDLKPEKDSCDSTGISKKKTSKILNHAA